MKKSTLFQVFLLLLLTLPASKIQAQESIDSGLRKLIEAQSGNMIENALSQIIVNIPESNRDAFKAEVKNMFDAMYTDVIAVYKEHCTEADLKKLLAFYETPAGKRILGKTSEIMMESQAIGQQMGVNKLYPLMQKYMAEQPVDEED